MRVKEIVSPKNPTFRRFLSALKGQGIKRYGMGLLSGPKQVNEVLETFPDRCAGLIVSKKHDVSERSLPAGLTLYRLGADLFREIDLHGTNQPVLILYVPPFPRWKNKNWSSGCTLFVPFQDPTNVGAAIRSAAAFGVSRVVVLKEAAHPFHHKSARVAGSALLRVSLFEGPSIVDLGKMGGPIFALSADGRDIREFQFPETFGIIPGLEGPGLPDTLRHITPLAIPMAPGIESINAALATGIALYLWYSGQKGARSGGIY